MPCKQFCNQNKKGIANSYTLFLLTTKSDIVLADNGVGYLRDTFQIQNVHIHKLVL